MNNSFNCNQHCPTSLPQPRFCSVQDKWEVFHKHIPSSNLEKKINSCHQTSIQGSGGLSIAIFCQSSGYTQFLQHVQLFLLLAPHGHILKSKQAQAGGHWGSAIPAFPAALCLTPTQGHELSPSAAGMKPKKHIVLHRLPKPRVWGILAPVPLLPHDKTDWW